MKRIVVLVFVILAVVGLFLSGCTKIPENLNETISCSTDSDCVPLPGCHPKTCINSKFVDNYEQAEFCTLVYMENAAYSKEDCLCEENICVNKNMKEEAIVIVEESEYQFDSWHYQTTGASFTSLLKLDVDLIVVDPETLSEGDIEKFNEEGKTVLAYLNLGDATGNYTYQDNTWQEIVIENANEISETNYNGYYLAGVGSYLNFEEEDEDAAPKMVAFVEHVINVLGENKIIVAEDAVALHNYLGFADMIDGYAAQNTWYNEETKRLSSEIDSSVSKLDSALNNGKFILAVDYPLTPSKICVFYSNCKLHDYGCTVTSIHLDRDQTTPCRN